MSSFLIETLRVTKTLTQSLGATTDSIYDVLDPEKEQIGTVVLLFPHVLTVLHTSLHLGRRRTKRDEHFDS